MIAAKRIIPISLLLILAILLLPIIGVTAAGPYTPTEDTYTDRNSPNDINGADENLLLSASTAGSSCVEATYLWFEFAIPATGTTIAAAGLELTIGATGSGSTDLELLGSTDISWSENSLAWSNQDAFVSSLTEYATATGASKGSVITLESQALADFINTNQGQSVTLVVRADCDGTVSPSVALSVASLENQSGSGAQLLLQGPNAVTLQELGARSGENSQSITLLARIIITLLAFIFGSLIILRRFPTGVKKDR